MGAEAIRYDFRALREEILRRRDSLPKRLAQVALFAMENPDDIAFGTAASIAGRAEVQPSTLVRFAQAFGYRGFSELQDVFRDRLRDRPASYAERLTQIRTHEEAGSKFEPILAGFCDAAERSIRILQQRVSAGQIEAAAGILAGAETIYLLGQRRSYPVTSYMSYAFGKLGVKTILCGSALGTDAETLGFAGPRDAAIAVSFTPYAASTIAHAGQLAEQRVPIVAITDSPFSPLVRNDGLWLEIAEADFEGFRSLAAAMTIAMTLTVAVAAIRRESGNGSDVPD